MFFRNIATVRHWHTHTHWQMMVVCFVCSNLKDPESGAGSVFDGRCGRGTCLTWEAILWCHVKKIQNKEYLLCSIHFFVKNKRKCIQYTFWFINCFYVKFDSLIQTYLTVMCVVIWIHTFMRVTSNFRDYGGAYLISSLLAKWVEV